MINIMQKEQYVKLKHQYIKMKHSIQLHLLGQQVPTRKFCLPPFSSSCHGSEPKILIDWNSFSISMTFSWISIYGGFWSSSTRDLAYHYSDMVGSTGTDGSPSLGCTCGVLNQSLTQKLLVFFLILYYCFDHGFLGGRNVKAFRKECLTLDKGNIYPKLPMPILWSETLHWQMPGPSCPWRQKGTRLGPTTGTIKISTTY